ncbi:chorismate-binding protein [Frankia sp. AgPm24]|uniref:anthranilate synthase family protein n=1 Tax=Frankia sp. AgPm24 TaxID=631128 RepID=UPI00200CB798|nr:chorismate-binding protein [Frankia sp. AgPm24]MCK9921034.1 chorismate-binding protein [Frankia sp. AgPm24]
MTTPIDFLTSPDAGSSAFALLHRPDSGPVGQLELLRGAFTEVAGTAALPVPAHGPPGGHHTLALLPYRLIGERGYAHHDDGEPLLAMGITAEDRIAVDDLLRLVADWPIEVGDGRFDLSDDEYAGLVRRVLAEEIGSGAGANFVLKRTFTVDIHNWSVRAALALFGRLLAGELGAYWTFLIHTGERTFIGASPERHVSLDTATAVMTPISGTYRYPATGPSVPEVLAFLADDKETNELYMVLDEELKMMSRVCDDVRVVGPHLKEMAHLAHTEYRIVGHSTRDVREILHETLFAPTVTGSPLQSACEVIARFEPSPRGYYAGVAALIGWDALGGQRLDSAILIRTGDVDHTGGMRVAVGATLVRDSSPVAEAQETRAKAAGLLGALRRAPAPRPALVHAAAAPAAPASVPATPAAQAVIPGTAVHALPGRVDRRVRLGDDPAVRRALAHRNQPLAPFWLAPARTRPRGRGRLLVVDAEDTFTAMGAAQLRSLGFEVTVRRFDEPYRVHGMDLVVLGPGPGDPRDHRNPKIASLRAITSSLLNLEIPFLSVCLSHQVLCDLLGFPVVRMAVPNQGVRRTIELFDRLEPVYFYNTYVALHSQSRLPGVPGARGPVEVARDTATSEVHALRGDGFASMQFHAASVMTRDGQSLMDAMVTDVLRQSRRARDGAASR